MENKKGISLPIKITLVGIVLGMIVAGIGLFKQIDAKKVNKEREEAAVKASEKAIKIANERLSEIEKEYTETKEQYETKQKECDSININDPSWFTTNSKCQRESSDLMSKMNNLEMEDASIKGKDYTAYYQKVKPMSYQIFYIIGASISVLLLLGAFIIYLVKGKKTY